MLSLGVDVQHDQLMKLIIDLDEDHSGAVSIEQAHTTHTKHSFEMTSFLVLLVFVVCSEFLAVLHDPDAPAKNTNEWRTAIENELKTTYNRTHGFRTHAEIRQVRACARVTGNIVCGLVCVVVVLFGLLRRRTHTESIAMQPVSHASDDRHSTGSRVDLLRAKKCATTSSACAAERATNTASALCSSRACTDTGTNTNTDRCSRVTVAAFSARCGRRSQQCTDCTLACC